MIRKPRPFSERRLTVVSVLAILWLVAILGRLAWLQIRQHDEFLARAERQHQFIVDVSPTRGAIFDRSGHELARSAGVESLYASPAKIEDPDSVAAKLSRVLGVEKEVLFKRLTSRQAVMVVMKRKLTAREVDAVKHLDLKGLSFVTEMKRFYLSGSTASHVLGFVDVDERGLAGVELSYDKLIRGRGGRLIVHIDALKNAYDHEVEETTPGADLTLTIDSLIQHDVEKALAQAVASTGARGGTIIVMRPATGEILALANHPRFDPNRVSQSTDVQRVNRAIESAYEPGSIFKVVTYAAALQEGVITPRSVIDCGAGEITLYGRNIRDGHAGALTAARALQHSSNVAAIKIAQRLGNPLLAHYIEAFGFGRKAGIELPAESRGLMRDVRRWQPSSIAAIPLGYEVGVTPLQAVTAFACIANGGEWVKPHIVGRITSSLGEVLEEQRIEARRVISRDAADDLKLMLEGVVLNGTGKPAQVHGYRVAGKTGTAQQVEQGMRSYSKTHYVASFAGFAPVSNPEIACIVVIDAAKGAHSGRDIAAPVFARVVSGILPMLGIEPEYPSQSRKMIAATPLGARDTFRLARQNPPPRLLASEPTVCYVKMSKQSTGRNRAPASATRASAEAPTDAN